MKKGIGGILCITLLLMLSTMAEATYIQSLDIYQYSIGGNISWDHTYDFSENAPLAVQLQIVADDVDAGEDDLVTFNGTSLGYLSQLSGYTNWGYIPGVGGDLTTTTFNIDPSLIDWSIPVNISIAYSWGAEIETSTLIVQGAPVPEPSTVLLLGAGVAGIFLYRRKSRTA